jgi:uncharacterized repeat protein (TIGR01451 family)
MIRHALAALLTALVTVLLAAAGPVYANWCAKPGTNGTGTISGVINTYYPGKADVAAGSSAISIDAATGAMQPIAVGDLLLVIQMQDATIGTANTVKYGSGTNGGGGRGYTSLGQSGRYEFVRATSAVGTGGGTLTIAGATGGGLTNAYFYTAPGAASARESFQVIKVPQYDQATISGTVSAAPWNGSAGGVVVLDVARRLTFNGGTVTASGLGFRGGGGRRLTGGAGSNGDYAATSTTAPGGTHGSKGEGIAGTPRYVDQQGVLQDLGVEGLPGGSLGRGAPGNAGGGGTDGNPAANDENTGGGGGSNVGAGGLGGHAWCTTAPTGCPLTGGLAAVAIPGASVTQIIMGGGGGAGTNNDGTGTPSNGLASSGAAGGGIVIVRAGEVAGTGTLSANGASAYGTVLNDGTGGGGAGGTILFATLNTVAGSSFSASAAGGNGGSNTGNGAAHGPGGGGGGGFIMAPFGVTTNVLGGGAGTTSNGGSYGNVYGAQGGIAGNGTSIVGSTIPGISSGGECTPTVTKSFASTLIAVGATNRMSIVVTNNNPNMALTALAFTDTYPAGLKNTASPTAAKSCTTATLAAAAAGTTFGVSAASVPAASSCTFSVNTTVSTTGDKVNTITAGTVVGTYGSYTVASLADASATVQVSAPLTILKASQVYSDPKNGTSNAKAIPGATMTYTLTVANPGAGTVDTNSIVVIDATPANLQLFVGDLTAGAGPLLFQNGSLPSGLTFSYVSLSSLTDDVDFSKDGGTTWTYVPTPNASGVDTAVTHLRIKPKGVMAGLSSFTLQLRYIVK